MSILTFGEILLRIQSQDESFWKDGQSGAKIYPGGSEANLAVTLANLGHPVSYLTAFPDNTLAYGIQQLLEGIGVDCDKSIIKQGRIGTYYLLSANGLSKGEVVYDRDPSSFTQLKLEDMDMDAIFQGVEWFHWTAITPALSMQLNQILLRLLQEAKNRDISVSVDLNYRSKLWQYGKAPEEVMPDLVKFCDVIMGNVWAAEKMLGYKLHRNLHRHSPKNELYDEAKQCAADLFTSFPTAKHIAMTYRFMDHPKHNLFFGTYHTRTYDFISSSQQSDDIVDRIGSGDAFMAGLIHALRSEMSGQEVVETATKEGFKKLFIAGDFNMKNNIQND